MTDELYTQSQVDALLQAANEAALREAGNIIRSRISSYPNVGDGFIPVLDDVRIELESLIPQPSALDRRLAEARLEEAEWWRAEIYKGPMREFIELGLDGKRIAELRRAVKGESDA
jgi:hypothetical protein